MPITLSLLHGALRCRAGNTYFGRQWVWLCLILSTDGFVFMVCSGNSNIEATSRPPLEMARLSCSSYQQLASRCLYKPQ
ncbi:hypothetical protein BDV34DRAFT_192017 [Aspergillus parasiticus]|uniref:Uncharacterized protein n=1 Tax=Aspergillus parasiticus TaxID=5067 RepID=A0A5N6DSZ0_ASPPA|nr:hypothetical protein BDV34DRAFT_192017 [Aspergillus parasiticus]